MGVLLVVHAKHNRAVDAPELQHSPCSEGLIVAPLFAPLIVVPHPNAPYIQLRVFRDFRTIDLTHYFSIIIMANTYSDQEDYMQEALDAIHDDYFISASAAAKHFNLKSRRVQYRLRGKASRKTRPQFYKRLTDA